MGHRTAIMTIDAHADGLVNEPQEKYHESGQTFRVEEVPDVGNEFIERATLIGNAVGNFESEGILQGLGAVVNVRGIFTPRSLKPSTHSGLRTQLAPHIPDDTDYFLWLNRSGHLCFLALDVD